ncbi:MAG: ABC transporter permease [Candidatus Carbobacillus sp.]|nr:ABC transporter permease [Candidatus Carbobacillus sp.]
MPKHDETTFSRGKTRLDLTAHGDREKTNQEQWVKAFFKRRIQQVQAKRLILIKRWLNGFGAIPVLLFLVLLAFYPQLIQALPLGFPLVFVISVVFAFFIAIRRVRPWFLEEDLYYLAPLGRALRPFWWEVERYSAQMTHLGLAFVWLLLWPLFMARVGDWGMFLLLGAMILLLNRLSVFVFFRGLVFSTWRVLFLRILYGLIVGLLLYGLMTRSLLIIVLGIVLMLFFVLGIYVLTRHTPLPYERLVLLERTLAHRERRWWGSFFEQSTNLRAPYVLVPPTRLRRDQKKKSMVWPYERKNVLFYLYFKLWLRNGDVRQWFLSVLVAVVVMRAFPYTVLQLAILFLLSWLMQQQMLTAEIRYTDSLWFKLFPFKIGEVHQSYRTFARRLVVMYVFLIVLAWFF